MYKIRATIWKDIRLLTRDKVGLTLMFVMPIILVLVITSIQNATFNLVNSNKVPLLISNNDSGEFSGQLKKSIDDVGMFEVIEVGGSLAEAQLSDLMKQNDALVTVVIPADYSKRVLQRAEDIASQSLSEFGVGLDSPKDSLRPEPLTMFYNPVLQESFRQSILGGLISAQKLVENKQVLNSLYFAINEESLPDSVELSIIEGQAEIQSFPILRDGSRTIPNATQHNIPAWTIFAMFFIVVSLGTNVVKEKISGSSVRLRTLPTNYRVALVSKEITYLIVCLAQVVVIFSIGIWIFPLIGLPRLNLPDDKLGLLIVSVLSGWCAVSYAICVGVFAETQEQANGFGAVSIVLLAAVGGILVPSFAMPATLQFLSQISPMHWCLEAFYGLFLEGGSLKNVLVSILPLTIIILVIKVITFAGLKKENLI